MLKRFLRNSGVVVAVLAIALPVAAEMPGAPPLQYAQFDSNSTEIRDTFTGLNWDRQRVTKMTTADAEDYCTLSVFPGAGRVPTVKELLTLVDELPHRAYEDLKYVDKAIDPRAFPDRYTPTDAPYLTRTTDGAGNVWTVEFTSGTTKLVPMTTPLNVRCVH
ncbi:MAG: hypothetical protein JWP97_2031 [Labilithrix sp.]|nr:hypothetical protein [Labilithrix sp.]